MSYLDSAIITYAIYKSEETNVSAVSRKKIRELNKEKWPVRVASGRYYNRPNGNIIVIRFLTYLCV